MSEPKPWDLWEVILEETDSKWVRWEDYARLEAENARLKAEVELLKENPMIVSLLAHLRVENARLKAEVERLTLASQGAVKYVDHTMALTRQSMEHHKQVSRLEAQVERLTKAGDAMAEIFKNEMDNEPDCVGYLQEKLVNRWNAAKEGKQP